MLASGKDTWIRVNAGATAVTANTARVDRERIARESERDEDRDEDFNAPPLREKFSNGTGLRFSGLVV